MSKVKAFYFFLTKAADQLKTKKSVKKTAGVSERNSITGFACWRLIFLTKALHFTVVRVKQIHCFKVEQSRKGQFTFNCHKMKRNFV